MLRLVVATFFMVFYIGSLAVFMVAINCNWFVEDREMTPEQVGYMHIEGILKNLHHLKWSSNLFIIMIAATAHIQLHCVHWCTSLRILRIVWGFFDAADSKWRGHIPEVPQPLLQ